MLRDWMNAADFMIWVNSCIAQTFNLYLCKSSGMISRDQFPKWCLYLLKQQAPNCSVTQLMVTTNYTRNPSRLYLIDNEIHEGFVRITSVWFYGTLWSVWNYYVLDFREICTWDVHEKLLVASRPLVHNNEMGSRKQFAYFTSDYQSYANQRLVVEI